MTTITYLPNKQGHYHEIKIPKYIQEILQRVKNQYNYTFILKAKYQYGRNTTLKQNMEKLKFWAERYGAECTIKEEHNDGRYRMERITGKNMPYIVFELTDPVCHQLEKAGYLK